MFSPASRLKAAGSEKMQVDGPSNAYYFEDTSHPELDHKVKKASDKFSENLQVIANEPSLAFFRIQEHVRKTLPQLSERKHEVIELQKQVQGSCFDTEYAINAVRHMERSSVHFQNIQDLLKNSMFMKQQLQYEQGRREQDKMRPSMYRSARAMMRTQTVDIPSAIHSRNEFSINTQLPNVSEQTAGAPRAGAPATRDGSPAPRARSSSLSDGTPPPAAVAAAAAAAAKASATRQAHALR